ncbi:MAG: cytochrome c biogenesis protein CcsA [Alphaproteobacteria bacterium]|nr:cytochrome c biogenesis protein CcsA [Alphaproteobacteria bacterium]MCB9985394.1 cytochrome c biogenesis protein CcsA [Micavibrio sp.]
MKTKMNWRILMALCLAIILSITTTAQAQSAALDMTDFKKIPILHDGRIKPLDTFARTELIRLSGKNHFGDKSAITWLAETLFDPGNASEQKIFKIENENLRHLMGLEERKKPFYAFVEISEGLEKTFPTVEQLMDEKPQNISSDQKDLLTLHENALEYTQIMRSLSLTLPLSVTIPQKWNEAFSLMPSKTINYLTLKKIDAELQQEIKSIITQKGENPEKYTPTEQQIAILGWQIKMIENAAIGNTVFRVIPDPWNTTSGEWISPWEVLQSGKGSPRTTLYLDIWSSLATSWQQQDNIEWKKQNLKLLELSQHNPSIEIIYNKISPFFSSLIFFSLSFLLCLLNLTFHHKEYMTTLATTMIVIALTIQAGGLLARIIVLERPPVGTLYESILFVGLVAPLFATLMERRMKNMLGLLSAGFMGTAIGLLALSMADEGDTMKVLTAVLNTQFWLTTHVLCITIGYGWCLVTSVLSHVMLVGQATNKLDKQTLKNLTHSQGTLALTALLFTATGTILGGIWADQSWGRFWGWDPKENGALLIVLWLVWIIHGKIAGQFSPTTVTMGLSFLSVIVGTAWIGVNLLGVGLHSYGFTEGLFWGLGIFTLLEMALIGGLSILIHNRTQNHAEVSNAT